MTQRLIAFAVLAGAAQVARAQTGATPTAGMGQMLLGLTAVIALVFALAWLARRLGVPLQVTSPLLKRVASLTVGARERVLIVEVADQWLVLGVTTQSIQTLHQLPKGELPAAKLGGNFAALLQKARSHHA
jgi:flagellar protein FliO/FliZ